MLKESEEFAAQYAPIARKISKPARRAQEVEAAQLAPKIEVKTFAPNTEEFIAAMRKISPELLRLVKDQFQTQPSALLSGVFEEKAPEAVAPSERDEPSDFSEEEVYDD